MLDKMGTLYQKFSPCNNPKTSKGKVILIPAAAEAESAAKISTIAISKLNQFSTGSRESGSGGGSRGFQAGGSAVARRIGAAFAIGAA